MPSFLSVIHFVVLWLSRHLDLFKAPNVVEMKFWANHFGSVIGLGFWLLLFSGFTMAKAVSICPHCAGHFDSCTYDTDGKCPTVDVVVSNAAIVALGSGVLTLSKIIKPRFMRVFSRVAFETILTLVKRKEPGASFDITPTTPATTILTAVQSGQVTLEMVLFKLLELMEAATDAGVKDTLKRRMEMLKTVSDIKVKLPSGAFSGLFDTGVLTFMWAKVSEFVMSKGMQVKLQVEGPRADSSSSSDLNATIHRPTTFEQFAEMMNLFGLYMHGLAICSYLVLADFYEHAIYDTIRMRGESWEFAHELMLVMFRRVEDSGGNLTLANVYNELYLNTVVDEARKNVEAFFRPRAGNAHEKGEKGDKLKYNGKYTVNSTRFCMAFNKGTEHSKAMLHPDGTCKFNHRCNKWVSNKGKDGRCLSTSHGCHACDNPHGCDERVTG